VARRVRGAAHGHAVELPRQGRDDHHDERPYPGRSGRQRDASAQRIVGLFDARPRGRPRGRGARARWLERGRHRRPGRDDPRLANAAAGRVEVDPADAREPYLHPCVGHRAANRFHSRRVALSGQVPFDEPGRNPLEPQHHHHGRGVVLAEALARGEQEVVDRVAFRPRRNKRVVEGLLAEMLQGAAHQCLRTRFCAGTPAAGQLAGARECCTRQLQPRLGLGLVQPVRAHHPHGRCPVLDPVIDRTPPAHGVVARRHRALGQAGQGPADPPRQVPVRGQVAVGDKHQGDAADHDQRICVADAAYGVIGPRVGNVALAAEEAVVFDARIGGIEEGWVLLEGIRRRGLAPVPPAMRPESRPGHRV